MTSPIERAAVEFIDARRKKLIAKAKRNDLLRECKEMNGSTCSFKNDDVSTWCELCLRAKPFDEAYHRQRDEMNNAVKRLERAVAKARGRTS
jgi:hypothetical protein